MAITSTIAIVAAAAIAAGATAYSAHASAEASEYNAKLAEQEAVRERQIAAIQEENARRKTRTLMSGQRAAFAASGVIPEGSPLELAEQATIDGELDALTLRYQGEVAAQRARAQGRLLRYQATTTRATGYAQAGATLIGGGADAYGAYSKLKATENLATTTAPAGSPSAPAGAGS